MHFVTAKEHRDFFSKMGWIEFAEVLSLSQLEKLNQGIDEALALRFQLSPDQLKYLSSEKLYLQGRDLWRSHLPLRKFLTQPQFAALASELTGIHPLRLGYDQLLPARPEKARLYSAPEEGVYAQFLDTTFSLQEISCLEGIACGVIVSLKGSDSRETTLEPFPRAPGHVLFFLPNRPIEWQHLYAYPKGRFYLIVYTHSVAHYRLQPSDPHLHALKHLGYIFNDPLNDRLNPIIR